MIRNYYWHVFYVTIVSDTDVNYMILENESAISLRSEQIQILFGLRAKAMFL